jgi:hypothetical protein
MNLLRDAADRVRANEAFVQDCEQRIAEIKESMLRSFGQVVLGSLAPSLVLDLRLLQRS